MTIVVIKGFVFDESSIKSAYISQNVTYIGVPSVCPSAGDGLSISPMNTSQEKTNGKLDAREGAEYYVLGGGALGATVAETIRDAGYTVELVDEAADGSDHRGDPTSLHVLGQTAMDDASTVVVATRDDAKNFLVAQLVRAHFDVGRTLVLSNHPTRRTPLADAGHEPVCVSTALAETIRDHL